MSSVTVHADTLLLLALFACCSVTGEGTCPPTALANGTRVAGVGACVVLYCGQEATEWRLNNKRLSPSRGQVINATTLILSSTQLRDTGNYACVRNGTTVYSVRLVIQEVPRRPTPSCILKSYLSPIRCEWSSQELGRWTRCTLSFRVRFMDPPSSKACKFYTGKRVCVCMLAHKEGEHENHFISMTVSNGAGCAISNEKMFTFENLLKSDPPESVRVTAVIQAPYKLNVSWSYPPTWQQGFYILKFQLTYGPKNQLPPLHRVDVKETTFLISDALPDTNYTVRVRAIEEFNHGTWSDWSKQAHCTPWTGPKPDVVPEDDSEDFPSGDDPGDESTPQGSHHPEWTNFPWYGPLLVAVSLFLVIMLLILIVVRYRTKWKDQASAKDKVGKQLEYVPVRLITASEAKEPEGMAETTLQQDPGPPGSGGVPMEGRPHFDVINVSYFYVP
ncbi:interleukin-6 receptor subunit alpha-like [Scyliorhinus torazame]|uniref:interleukin-6 receptor subunit alpha-like n=1 Tax=Scyliorhinus torazame TaxID=75743 RepID=UPI003B5B24D5